MNPGIKALEQLVEIGVFAKGAPAEMLAVQYWASRHPTKKEWAHVSGLVHKAASFCGTRGLYAATGRVGAEVVYSYYPKEDNAKGSA